MTKCKKPTFQLSCIFELVLAINAVVYVLNSHLKPSWWFQPIWKNIRQTWESAPKLDMNIFKKNKT